MRAMSLTADDGEGEQSDYRNLQAQLDATNRLVKNLSKQLTDLKEQVGWPLTYLVCLGYCGIIIATHTDHNMFFILYSHYKSIGYVQRASKQFPDLKKYTTPGPFTLVLKFLDPPLDSVVYAYPRINIPPICNKLMNPLTL